jgi:hypothetical protein
MTRFRERLQVSRIKKTRRGAAVRVDVMHDRRNHHMPPAALALVTLTQRTRLQDAPAQLLPPRRVVQVRVRAVGAQTAPLVQLPGVESATATGRGRSAAAGDSARAGEGIGRHHGSPRRSITGAVHRFGKRHTSTLASRLWTQSTERASLHLRRRGVVQQRNQVWLPSANLSTVLVRESAAGLHHDHAVVVERQREAATLKVEQ